MQHYTSNSLNLRVKDGKLIITAIYDSVSNTFFSAKITTKNKVDFQKGYLEVVAKLPNAVGTWPAIWMLPTVGRSLNWPLDGEIDIKHLMAEFEDTKGTLEYALVCKEDKDQVTYKALDH